MDISRNRISENIDYETDLLKAQSGCVVDVNFNSKVKELTATGKVIIFGVCLLLSCCLEAGKVRDPGGGTGENVQCPECHRGGGRGN